MSRENQRKKEKLVKNMANKGKKAMENFIADRNGLVNEDMLIGFKAGYIAGISRVQGIDK